MRSRDASISPWSSDQLVTERRWTFRGGSFLNCMNGRDIFVMFCLGLNTEYLQQVLRKECRTSYRMCPCPWRGTLMHNIILSVVFHFVIQLGLKVVGLQCLDYWHPPMLVNWPNELTDGPPIFYFHVVLLRKSKYDMYVAPRILFPRGGHFLILIHHSSFPSTWHEPKQGTVLPRYWGRETKMISSVGIYRIYRGLSTTGV